MGCCCCCLGLVVILPLLGYYLYRQWMGTKSLKPLSEMKSRSVVITGCDTGFGNGAALQMSSEKVGMKVFAACLTDKAVKELSAKKNPNLIPFQMDVTDESSVKAGANFVSVESPEGVWALINNAGVLRGGASEMMSMDTVKFQFDVNVFGVASCVKHFYPQIRKVKGRIVNVASVVGRCAMPGLGAYSASKHAVEGLTDSLRMESSPWGVDVCIIEPGVIPTPLYDSSFEAATHKKIWEGCTQEQRELFGEDYVLNAGERGKKTQKMFAGMNSPQMVIDAMIAATRSKSPLARYRAGKDTALWLSLSYLPTMVTDGVFWKLALKDRNLPKAILDRIDSEAKAKASAKAGAAKSSPVKKKK